LIGPWIPAAWALDPHKTLSQYSRAGWTQEDGLPQDTIRAITQTADGYLWLGTDEGLARFDGYEFTTFNRTSGDLPSNSITALASTPDGALWIGTSEGLTIYRDKRFHTYTVKDGLPENSITVLYTGHAGELWIVAGVGLSCYRNGRFTNYLPGLRFPVTSVRTVAEDRQHRLWVAGYSVVGTLVDGRFTEAVGEGGLAGTIVLSMTTDQQDNLWVAGSTGVLVRSPQGLIRKYTARDGLPDSLVRAIWCDRDGNIWAGTNGGVARFDGNRFVSRGHDPVRCLLEDREGDLWVGQNTGLSRLRDDLFTAYGKTEGLPSDEPNVVFQDHSGRVWIGFHDAGLMLFAGAASRLFTTRDGLPNNEIFSIHEAPNGDLLIAARGGLVRLHDDRITTFRPPDPLSRVNVYDVLEDSEGRIWLATPGGLDVLEGHRVRNVLGGAPTIDAAFVTLSQGRDGVLWAGTYGKGLWRVEGDRRRLYTEADGLGSDSMRSLYQDPDGTLWIGTFGGGLNAWRGGRFLRFTQKDGLLSDNVAGISDDGESLWLSTTRGISRVSKRQLREFAEGRRHSLEPLNYGVDDGLRSAQCAPGYPVGGGGHRMNDGRLWFTTSRGLEIYDPRARRQAETAPAVHVVEVDAGGAPVDLSRAVKLPPEARRLQFHYTAIHLSAPERVQYSYQLEGLDTDWVRAGSRRVINYNSLRHGNYRFTVKAEIPGGPSSQQSYAFVLLPYFYETAWFRLLAAAALAALGWAVYQGRLRQIRARFGLVLEERARLAREIHDTLAQGFVGISSQLDAVAMCLPDETSPARKYLDMARRMARHSLTEARRSVMDLRASMLEDQDLASALQLGTRLWTAGSPVDVTVDVTGSSSPLPEEMEQHLLRIAQEAVTNVLKHANAHRIGIKLHMEAPKLYLRIVDDGRGFEPADVFSSLGGHFGLIGMRERAERLGGELSLRSHPGEGTEVEVRVPLP